MKENHVLIEKVKVRLYTGSKKSAYDLKDNASDFLKNVVFKIIEDYLKQYQINSGQNEKMTVFNHLKLNFAISERYYKDQFAELSVEQDIRKQLDTVFYSLSSDKSNIDPDVDADNKVSYSEIDILQNSFICFLETGTLPWYCNEELRQWLFTEESIQLLFSENQFIERFLTVCKNKVTRQRLVYQLNEEVILNILNLLLYRHRSTGDLTSGFLVFKHLFFSGISRKDRTEVMNNLLILFYLQDSEAKIQKMLDDTEKLILAKDINQKTIDRLITFFKSENFCQNPDILNQLGLAHEKRFLSGHKFISEESETKIIHEDSGEDTTPVNEIPKESKETIISVYEDPDAEMPLLPGILEAVSPSIQEIPEEPVIPIEEMAEQTIKQPGKQQIANAGLIIVHPFLKTFFERLGLLSETSQLKEPELCVHLLHYIATGIDQDYEYQLSFEKLLCGVPREAPVERFVLLTEEMKQEAEGLLRAILDNWAILRNSGTELLQHEFLKREGLIHTDEKNIQISFERKAQDILIDKLEWTLSFIKLPWLNKIIRVNW